MARGYVAGGMGFGVFGVVFCVLSGVIPMWIVSQSSLVGDMCWLGEGIWTTSYRWGSDIPSIKLKCNPDAGLAASSYDAYCGDATTSVHMSSDYKQAMCHTTNNAKAWLIASFISALIGLGFGYASHRIRRFRYQIYCSGLATTGCLLALTANVVVLIVMLTSPMYQQKHFDELSRHFSPKYDGISCVYELPSLSSFIKHGNFDGPMHCLFPGPSFAFSIAAIFGNLFSTGFFALKFRESILIRGMTLHHDEEIMVSHSHSPLFGATISPAFSHASSNDDPTMHLLSPSLAIPTMFQFDKHCRHYSLYGATVRRFSHKPWFQRHLITLLPVLFNVLHAVVIAFWIFNGTVFGLEIKIEEVKHHNRVLTTEADAIAEIITTFVQDPSYNDVVQIFLRNRNYTLLEQIIEYSPVTITGVYLKADSYFSCIVQILGTFLWPVTKALLWAWFWYTPADEVFRGRLFSWIDALGKVNLASLFVMIIMALSNRFLRVVTIPWYLLPPFLVQPFHSLQVSLQCGIHVGIGTYGYVLAFSLSLFMGEAYLAVHRYARTWEEDRREEEESTWVRNRDLHIGNESASLIGEFEPLTNSDTPFWAIQENHELRNQRSNVDTVPMDRDESEIPAQFSLLDPVMNAQVKRNIKPHSTSLSSYIFSPVHASFYTCTVLGKLLVLCLCIITLTVLLVAQQSVAFRLVRSGVVGDFVIPYTDRTVDISVFNLPQLLQEAGIFSETPKLMVFAYVLFVVAMPIIHIVGLAAMWVIPMTHASQKNYIHLMEIVSSWSALDVFLVVVLAMHLDLKSFFAQLIDAAGVEPVDKIISKYLPNVGAFYIQDEGLATGFWYLICFVVLEKFLEHLIQVPFATMISEISASKEVAKKATELSQSFPTAPIPVHIIRENLELLSPATRYVTGSGKESHFYAGMPLFAWRFLSVAGITTEDHTFTL